MFSVANEVQPTEKSQAVKQGDLAAWGPTPPLKSETQIWVSVVCLSWKKFIQMGKQ